MTLPKLEGLLTGLLRDAAEGRAFLWVCASLSLFGTFTALYPVTAVVVPGALLMPRHWLRLSLFAALGSALGATLLVIAFHHLGWSQIYERFPAIGTNPTWLKVMAWMGEYGVAALFIVALSPLPQTPALVFFGLMRHDYLSVFLVMLSGKALKYAAFAWAASHFPERFSRGARGLLGAQSHSDPQSKP